MRARIVFDMVYNPVETKFIKQAKAKGIATIPGLEMFVQQGARQFEIWSGKPAPIEEMRGVVMKALGEVAAAEPAARTAAVEPEKPEANTGCTEQQRRWSAQKACACEESCRNEECEEKTAAVLAKPKAAKKAVAKKR